MSDHIEKTHGAGDQSRPSDIIRFGGTVESQTGGDLENFIDVSPKVATMTRDREQLLQLALGANGMGTWELNLVTGKVTWSDRTCALHGVNPHDLIDGSPTIADAKMHPADQLRVRALHQQIIAGQDSYDIEYRTLWDNNTHWIAARGSVLERTAEGPTHLIGVVWDITALKDAESARQTEASRLAAIFAASQDALYAVSLDGHIETWNPAAEVLFGYSAAEICGRHVSILADEKYAAEQNLNMATVTAGNSIGPMDTIRLRKDGRRFNASVSIGPMRAPDGSVIGMSAAVHDISDRKEWEARQLLMSRELAHRVKNSFAVLQSILRSTLKVARDPEHFAEAFSGRLHSLAAAQDILSANEWRGAELGALAHRQLAFYCESAPGRMHISGPDINLPADYAAPFGLILNELATNAVKHGALSVDTGIVELHWHVEKAPYNRRRLTMTWTEKGGPDATTPGPDGFGTTLIEKSLASAKVTRSFNTEGLICEIQADLKEE
jgi:PAS domain S-box-containing protein